MKLKGLLMSFAGLKAATICKKVDCGKQYKYGTTKRRSDNPRALVQKSALAVGQKQKGGRHNPRALVQKSALQKYKYFFTKRKQLKQKNFLFWLRGVLFFFLLLPPKQKHKVWTISER